MTGSKRPSASCSSRADDSFRRRRPFGVMTTSGRALGSRPPAEEMEVLRRRAGRNDADVLLGRELQEALEPRARVLGAVALVAVRQQQGEPRGLAPLREARDEKLVRDDLRAVDEVAVLRLPEHEGLRRADRVAVLEAERRVLGQGELKTSNEADASPRLFIGVNCSPLPGSWRTRWRCANVPRSVSWPVSRTGSLRRAGSQRRAPRRGPSRSLLLEPVAATLELPLELRVDGEALGDAQELLVQRPEPVGLDGGRNLGASVGGVRSLGGCSRRLRRATSSSVSCGLEALLDRARELVGLLLGDDALVDELCRVLLAHARCSLIRSAMSGCVYAGSSPSL